MGRGGPIGGGRGDRGRGRGGRGGDRGGRGGFQRRDFGPPAEVIKIGVIDKIVEGKLICKCTHKDVPILRR